MEELENLYDSEPLPYQYVRIPGPNDPPNRTSRLRLFVHKVITKLSTEAFRHSGFLVSRSFNNFNTSWGRQYHASEYSSLKAWQKINHFAGAFLMGRKDELNLRMHELKERNPEAATFYPESYQLPGELNEITEVYHKYKHWISKPAASSRGRGIKILDSDVNPIPKGKSLIQYYIERPLLITGRKFDVRLYVLVTSISPMRIYMHDSGLARFCTVNYDENDSSSDLKMHLTNFSMNKDSQSFVRCNSDQEDIKNSKWSLSFLLDYFDNNGIDSRKVMEKFERVSISTILAGSNSIRPHHQNLIKHRHTSYEMYGIDIILDENLNPYIMEINISPAMSGLDSKLDADIKWRLMLELLSMARIIDCDCSLTNPCPGIELIDQAFNLSLTPKRLYEVETMKIKPWDDPVFADFVIIRDFMEERPRKAGFKRIFPKRDTMDSYTPIFEKYIYQDIVLHDWIAMTHQQRFNVIHDNWDIYKNQMKEIRSLIPERSLDGMCDLIEEEDYYYSDSSDQDLSKFEF